MKDVILDWGIEAYEICNIVFFFPVLIKKKKKL